MKKTIITISISLASLCNAQINLSSGLAACYALNGNANEPINNLTGTLSAITSTVDRNNNPNSAVSFNGSVASYISLPDDPLLKSTVAMSFGGWVRTDTLMKQYLVTTRTTASFNFEAYDLVITFSSGNYRLRAQKGNGGNTIMCDGTTIVSASTWYHVYTTIDSTAVKLYVNGSLEQSMPSTFAFDYMTGKKVIMGGTNESSFNLPFKGSLDNFRFYNRTLSASEINQLYTSDPSCSELTSSIFENSAQVTGSFVYPNPFTGKFFVNVSNEQIKDYLVFDVLGNLIQEGKLDSENKNMIDFSEQPAGIYFLRLKSEGTFQTIKIIKE